MKKSLVIISFAFIFFIIFLIGINFVSAAECSPPICSTTSTECGSAGGGDYVLIEPSCDGPCASCSGDSCRTGCRDPFTEISGGPTSGSTSTPLKLKEGVIYFKTGSGEKVTLDSFGNIVSVAADSTKGLKSGKTLNTPRGWKEVAATDGSTCFVKGKKPVVKWRRDGGVIRWWGNGQVIMNENGDIVLTQN